MRIEVGAEASNPYVRLFFLLLRKYEAEGSVAATSQEALDRGFECLVVEHAATAHRNALGEDVLNTLSIRKALLGAVASSESVTKALESISDAALDPNAIPWDGSLRIPDLQKSYRGGLSVIKVVEHIYNRIEDYQQNDPAVWIHLLSKAEILASAEKLTERYPDPFARPALFGISFSVKDSIDVASIPTTTACPPLLRHPTETAPVVEQYLEAGAILIGKTNLEQFATGMTGCRSPYGNPHSVFHQDYTAGGSSSGSCISVGANLVSFSVASDTAGSGRVPAGYNGVVGYKPTRGLVSARGVTPACLSLDCVAFIAHEVEDARKVWQVCEAYDEEDIFSKNTIPVLQKPVRALGSQYEAFKFGIPPEGALKVCAPVYRRKFKEAVQKLGQMGGEEVQIDWAPFEKAGKLLYEGTFVSERLAGLPDGWVEEHAGKLHPVIRKILEGVQARNSTAVQAYRDIQAKAL